MTEWKARRFWTAAHVEETGDGFGVALDARPVRTPSKLPLAVPTRALAEAIAAEWDAQQGTIDPTAMPMTRAANSAIEKVRPQRREVAEMLAAYGDSDLLCYRADGPEGLVARQSAAWDPLLDWAARTFDARLIPVEGVIHRPQPPQALARLAQPVHAMDEFELTGFHDLVALSGSLVIGLAAAAGHETLEDLWRVSRIDEDWQIEQWGKDDEAARAAETKRQSFHDAARFLRLSRD